MARYTDWEIAIEHARLLQGALPSPMRKVQVRKFIEGMTGRRLGEGLRAGVYVKPIGGVTAKSFSDINDVDRSSLIVVATKSTTGESREAPMVDRCRQAIRGLFDNRRATCLPCEIFSYLSPSSYEIDEALQRTMDVDLLVVTTRYREDR